ncbi:MAG: pyruvate, phosphate dikinase [Oscillospiraceae bacterium]|nr:pyruvate, phosphate dikinase [Oscillospiraceae bacterium]
MKFIYTFPEAKELSKELIGGKAWSLVKMCSLNLPVPAGFIITTEACKHFYQNGKKLCEELKTQIIESLAELEKITGKQFFSVSNSETPLLLSARSGSCVSMPGMMDTILNIGMNDFALKKLESLTRNTNFAFDTYTRFIQMFSDIVMGIPKSKFEKAETHEEKLTKFKNIYKNKIGFDFPQDPQEQLFKAINAIFCSWENSRAKFYRKMHNIPCDAGTAVIVQSMVFGNFDENSGSGVFFSRNPITGKKEIFGEYLKKSQGEDIVSGVFTPISIENLKNSKIWSDLNKVSQILESYFKDMQDMEFTIERGKLYMLQTRCGKRSHEAAVKIALDFYKENLINKTEAINRVECKQMECFLYSHFDEEKIKQIKPIAQGLAASPGVAIGKVVFDPKKAILDSKNGQKIILVRNETSPEDIEAVQHSQGILTACGGMTSHAAVVTRGMGKCCISGCNEIKIFENSYFEADEKIIHEGDLISIDGFSGKVYLGEVKTIPAKFSDNLNEFLELVDSNLNIKVLANADNSFDVKKALEFGAQGVGLCRTEHMFFAQERINCMRKMIFAVSPEERNNALKKLLVFQKNDFKKMFKLLMGKPFVIRFLDPPLHEFLPNSENEILKTACSLGISFENLKISINNLKEFNPMMGHRGCRLLISYPEIAQIQAEAIFSTALETNFKNIEIMIPLIGDINELKFIKNIIKEVYDRIIGSTNSKINYKFGTMIEIPRAALIADKIAKEVDFFSFGTNDLTQMTYGLSRDDSQKFLKHYYDNNIYKSDPFAHIDIQGVGELMKIAINLGKKSNPNLKIGVCGEHAGDPQSIKFFASLNIDYISCSPYRLIAARLAASQNSNCL